MRSKILTFGKAKKNLFFPHLIVPLNIRSKVLTLDKAN